MIVSSSRECKTGRRRVTLCQTSISCDPRGRPMNDAIDLPDLKSLGAIGQPLRRKEDERLLTGRGRFSDDFTLPEQTYAAIVRSPYPHARIARIDTRSARAMPGTLGVFTGQDCAADKLAPIPHSPAPQTR